MSGRYYKYMGRELPSVTTITGLLDKPALVGWAGNAACDYVLDEVGKQTWPITLQAFSSIVEAARTNFRKVGRKAMDIGSKVHAAIEEYLQSGREPFRPEDAVLSGFLAFLEWQGKHRLEVITTEQTVYAERYAGTCDLICKLNGKRYLIDFKTSKLADDAGAYPEHRYQVAAYRQTDAEIEGCGILYLNKETGKPLWRDSSGTYDGDRAVFNILVDLWWASHKNKSKQFNDEVKK